LIPASLGIVGLAAVIWWISAGPVKSLDIRLPNMDRPAGVAGVAETALVAKLATFKGRPAADLPGSWPGFRGAKRDGIAGDGVALARSWPAAGPPKLWSVELGEGYAGAAIHDGRVYVLDYDREASADALRCFSLADGQEIWRNSYSVPIKRNHGMSRTVPVISDRYVVTLGPKCHVGCFDRESGESLWLLDLVKRFRSSVPQWYAGQCPLVDGKRAILAPGGDALLIAVDLATGQVVWKSPNPQGWAMTHVSIVPMEFAGKKMYVYCGKGGVAGVSADDGQILWETTDWKIAIATVPSPVVLPEGKIFFCGGYNAGALLLQLVDEQGKLVPKTLRKLKAGEFGATQQTPILYQGHLYGIREKDKELVCLDLAGKVVWSSGSQHRFGAGPYLIAEGMLYIMDDAGKLTLAEATPQAYRQLAQAQVLDGGDSWGPLALVQGRLFVRDLTHMACLDVAKK